MPRIARIVTLLAACCLALAACSPADDPRDQPVSQQALVTGQSAPPAGGWASVGAQGWLCAPSSWDPFGFVGGSAAWPAHGWCQWSPASGYLPWRVRACDAAPPWPGTVQIFTGDNYTGSCAQLYGDDINANNTNGGYVFNSDLVQVGGWYNHWTNSSGTHDTRIRSIKIAASTDVILCEGPMHNAWDSCVGYESWGAATTGATNYAHLYRSDNVTPFDVAAIQLGYRP